MFSDFLDSALEESEFDLAARHGRLTVIIPLIYIGALVEAKPKQFDFQ